MIWNAEVYCTPVVRDSLIVSLHCTLAYKPRRKRPLRVGLPQGRKERIERVKGRYRRAAGPSTRHSGQFRMRNLRKTIRRVQECCGSSGTSLSLSAIRLSSGSERAFILCIRRLRCTFTVASAMPISPAICLLRRPCAT
jgi:hypothetical protein